MCLYADILGGIAAALSVVAVLLGFVNMMLIKRLGFNIIKD